MLRPLPKIELKVTFEIIFKWKCFGVKVHFLLKKLTVGKRSYRVDAQVSCEKKKIYTMVIVIVLVCYGRERYGNEWEVP